MARIRLCLVGAVALVAVSCQDHGSPTGVLPPLSAEFFDATHGGGNPHFYLLPPFVSQPDLTKEAFESGLQPSVRVTEMAAAGVGFERCTNEHIAYLPATEFTRLKAYAAFWRPGNYPTKVTAPCIYRLQVELFGTAVTPGTVLGFADVQVISKTTIKSLQTGEYIPLPKDLTLPFWFFIGQGAVCPPGRDCVEAVINPTIDNTVITTNKQAGIFIPAGAFAGPVTLVIEQETARPCIEPSKLGLPQFNANRSGCYRYHRFPDNVALTQDLTVAMCVEIGLLSHEEAERLQIFRFDPGEGSAATALENASAGFLPCDAPPLINGLVPRVLDNLAALVRPRALHAAAIHLGVGGVCLARRCLSSPIFTWGMPGTVTNNSADPQTAASGTLVAAPPSVRVVDLGNPRFEIAPQPIANATVKFQVGGGGSIAALGGTGASTVVLTTDASGIATLGSWRLGSTPGTNTVQAAVAGAGNTVTFTATATAGVNLLTVNLSSTTLTIKSSEAQNFNVPYTASILNSTGTTLSVVFIQAYIDQGTAHRGANGSNVTCGPSVGVLPAGTCPFSFTVGASNLGGTGTLVPGPATAVFELRRFDSATHTETLLDTFTVPVTLRSP